MGEKKKSGERECREHQQQQLLEICRQNIRIQRVRGTGEKKVKFFLFQCFDGRRNQVQDAITKLCTQWPFPTDSTRDVKRVQKGEGGSQREPSSEPQREVQTLDDLIAALALSNQKVTAERNKDL